jgi:hypothetical protein
MAIYKSELRLEGQSTRCKHATTYYRRHFKSTQRVWNGRSGSIPAFPATPAYPGRICRLQLIFIAPLQGLLADTEKSSRKTVAAT